MIKSKFGPIRNTETGKEKDINVKAVSPNNFKDILIGGGIVLVGITYLTVSAFKNGAKAFEEAEYKVLEDLDLFTN